MSTDFDLVIRGGKIAAASDIFNADIGIQDGKIVALGTDLAKGKDGYCQSKSA